MISPHRMATRRLRLPSIIARPAIASPVRSYATYNTNFTSATSSSPIESQETPHSSVNQTEVSHFNVLASSWWDPHGSSRLLHLMNPLRHDFIQSCLQTRIRDESQKLRYLDIGCGGGIFAESAARRSNTASVTAIDPTPQVISIARKHARTDPLLCEPGRLTYLNTAIENLPVPSFENASTTDSETDPQGYDIITVFEVIEHIQQPAPFLRTVLQHLRPGGWLIGSTIARTGTSWLTTKLMAEDILQIVPRGTHEWSQYIQPYEMRDWAMGEACLDTGAKGERFRITGVVYVPGVGWKEVTGSESWGNYFFGVRKLETDEGR